MKKRAVENLLFISLSILILLLASIILFAYFYNTSKNLKENQEIEPILKINSKHTYWDDQKKIMVLSVEKSQTDKNIIEMAIVFTIDGNSFTKIIYKNFSERYEVKKYYLDLADFGKKPENIRVYPIFSSNERGKIISEIKEISKSTSDDTDKVIKVEKPKDRQPSGGGSSPGGRIKDLDATITAKINFAA